MKKFITILFPALGVLVSCQDFLEVKPLSQSIAVDINKDKPLYESASELEAALAGVYADFRNEYFELDYFVNGDAQSDDCYAGADNPNNFQIDDYRIDATNKNVSRDWAYLYGTIGKANRVINNVDSVNDPLLTELRKKEIIAEASFIRAFCYFDAVRLWGDVPLQLKEVKTISSSLLPSIYPIIFPPRADKQEVYDQIIKDLNYCAGNCRTTVQHKGFASKGAANAMLAKVYATMEPHDWGKVSQYCDAVIGGGYSLLPDYEHLWDNRHENSVESIFEINYFGGSIDHNWGTQMFRGMDWKKFNIPSNDLVALYDAEGDLIRKNATIIFLDVTGKWSDNHWPQTHYPFLNKYRKFLTPSDQNYIFIRLADILLLKAEALNEIGDLNAAALLVNQIRARVNLANTSANNKEQMKLAIEKERRLELAFEGHRWYDLKRTGRAVDVINAVKGQNGQNLGYNLTNPHLVWPIPQIELDKNSKLTQNEGY